MITEHLLSPIISTPLTSLCYALINNAIEEKQSTHILWTFSVFLLSSAWGSCQTPPFSSFYSHLLRPCGGHSRSHKAIKRDKHPPVLRLFRCTECISQPVNTFGGKCLKSRALVRGLNRPDLWRPLECSRGEVPAVKTFKWSGWTSEGELSISHKERRMKRT